ncbi:MAG: hypothetical protein AB8I08_08655 [Sandaracinaceae bacterium]
MSQRPPLPRRTEVSGDCDLLRFVRLEDDLDATLAFVERVSRVSERPVDPRLFEPPSFEDTSERLDLESVVDRLSSAPAPAGMLHARRFTDPGLAGRRVDMDAVLERISMTPSINLTPSDRPLPLPVVVSPAPWPSWSRLAAVAVSSFVLGSAITYLAG